MIPRVLFRAALACVVLLLSACTVSRAQLREAQRLAITARDQTIDCHAPDACALASHFLPLYEQAAAASTADRPAHFVTLLDGGTEALLARVHLIRAARRSIDLQTFILTDDDAGRLLLDELLAAARRGVKVRVLIDQLFSLGDTELLAALAQAHGNFQFKVYNPTFGEARTGNLEFMAGIVCCFFHFNQRMHNKLLLIDAAIGIVGGRNYEDRYFDWDPGFNYRDRDVMVAGPAAAAEMRASFDHFWKHRTAVSLARLKDVAAVLLAGEAAMQRLGAPVYKRPERVARLSRWASDSAAVAAHFGPLTFRVGPVEYFSDLPNKGFERHRKYDRDLTRRLLALLKTAEHSMLLQTPYLVISKPAQRVFRKLQAEHPGMRVVVSTNSLAATDAFYVYALSHKHKKRYLRDLKFEIYEFKPFPGDAARIVSDYEALAGNENGQYKKRGLAPLTRRGSRIGMHAKSIVIDSRVTLIGSHNFDPRSDQLNTESGFVIYDRQFAEVMTRSIQRDIEPQNAWVIAPRQRRIPLLGHVNSAIGVVSENLPLFDLWPFRYATSYELKDSCAPMPASDPEFYACHEPVGDFPEVNLSLKDIYTRIITAFGAGLTPIL